MRTYATLEQLLASPYQLVEIVVLDEYTHDVVMRAPAEWLVFDTT